MKKNIFVIIILFTGTLLHAQTPTKYNILSTGCTVTISCNLEEFKEKDKTDSTLELVGNCEVGSLTYGVIYKDGGAGDIGEDYTMQDHLKITLGEHRDFVFECNASYIAIMGVKQSADGTSISIDDIWEDYRGNRYNVTGYTNGKIVAILYVKQKGKLADSAAVKAFLGSFTFPGSK